MGSVSRYGNSQGGWGVEYLVILRDRMMAMQCGTAARHTVHGE